MQTSGAHSYLGQQSHKFNAVGAILTVQVNGRLWPICFVSEMDGQIHLPTANIARHDDPAAILSQTILVWTKGLLKIDEFYIRRSKCFALGESKDVLIVIIPIEFNTLLELRGRIAPKSHKYSHILEPGIMLPIDVRVLFSCVPPAPVDPFSGETVVSGRRIPSWVTWYRGDYPATEAFTRKVLREFKTRIDDR